MASLLHLIRDPRDARALETAFAHNREGWDRVLVVLLHDAVIAGPHRLLGLPTRLGAEDCRARGIIPPEDAVDARALLELCFAHDRVILW